MNQIMVMSQMMIFLPIIVSVMIYIFNKVRVNYLAFMIQTFLTAILVRMWATVITNGIVKFTLGGWTKQIGIEFKIDHLSLIFMTMAIIIWWVILLYAWHQKKADFKFLFFLMFLEGCFLALVQVNDFFTIFVLIEIITIISSILILYKKDGISLRAGLYYLLFNSIGMTIYLFGIALIYLKVGTLNVSLVKAYLISQDYASLNYSIVQISFACFFVSMCVKAALLPVYDWLPRAHTAAPSHISALLSGLLVKTGIYGLIRILDVYHIDSIYQMMFYLGFFTALSGSLFAIAQNDIKGMLAFSTISQIGLIIMSLASNSDIGHLGAYMHLFNHFLFKSLLFLGAGIIINEYGVRRVTEIRGIGRAHPLLSLSMFIGILSLSGAPLTIGFLSKNMIKLSFTNDLYLILFQVVSVASMIYFVKFSRIFFGEPIKKRKINKGQQVGVLILASLCVFFFVYELNLIGPILAIEGPVSEGVKAAVNYLSYIRFANEYVLEYLVYLAIAVFIYKLLVRPKVKVWHKIRHFKLKFQDAIVTLLLFFVLVIYTL